LILFSCQIKLIELSSINLFPTFEYSQPDEYHFSHDSVFLARRVFEFLRDKNIDPNTALDLCAGSGVIGLDLLFYLRAVGRNRPQVFDFLDVQCQYRKHFEENVRRLGTIQAKLQFINSNYADENIGMLADVYDLIVCNPPYFSIDQGKLPTSNLKLRSRFFVDSDLESLFVFIDKRLSQHGFAFVLIRNQLEHKQNQLSVVQEFCNGKLHLQVLDDVRGTDVVLLSRR
jgi:tRNA1Val (adenine37-N6)-methyltransferase